MSINTKAPKVVLKIDNLESYYGPIQAIRGVSLKVNEGQIVTVLGANGAGKTTLLKTISGVMDPEKGTIKMDGIDIHSLEPDAIVHHGIVHVPEGREISIDDRWREHCDGCLHPQRPQLDHGR